MDFMSLYQHWFENHTFEELKRWGINRDFLKSVYNCQEKTEPSDRNLVINQNYGAESTIKAV